VRSVVLTLAFTYAVHEAWRTKDVQRNGRAVNYDETWNKKVAR